MCSKLVIELRFGRQDDAALAIAHAEDRKIVLDVLERYQAPHNPYDIVAQMCDTLRRYAINRAIGDAYAAEWTRTAFASHGVNYRRATTSVWNEGTRAKNRIAKPKSILYAELLPRLHSGEVELLDHDILIAQLASLQRRTRSGARDQIDHPPGGHDDCANVLAGACDAVAQRPRTAGSLHQGTRSLTWWEKEQIRFDARCKSLEEHHRRLAELQDGVGHSEGFLEGMMKHARRRLS
jgi:hypothetical protein